MRPNGDSLHIVNLASGSKGNATVLRSHGTTVLLDLGISFKQLRKRMNEVGMEPEEIDAVVVTHEHRDHVQGLPVFCRRQPPPVYLTATSWDTWRGDVPAERIRHFDAGTPFAIQDLEFTPFDVSHDAAQTVSFTVTDGKRKVGIVTDLGTSETRVEANLRGCDALLIEFNHDYDTLIAGPYPWHLKQRVRERRGHLSNEQAAELVRRVAHPGLRSVMCTHLSEVNNTPRHALESAQAVLAEAGLDPEQALLAWQGQPSRLISLP